MWNKGMFENTLATSGYVIFVSVICYIIYWYAYGKFQFFKRIGIPGPEPSLFIGNTFQIFFGKHAGQMFMYVHENLLKYKSTFGLFSRGHATYVVSDPEMLKEIIVKKFANFTDRNHFHDRPYPLTLMLSSSMGDQWKFVRSKLAPSFTSGKLRLMSPLFNKSTNTCIEILETKVGEVFNIMKIYQGFSMESIISASFGIESKSQTDANNHLVSLIKEFFNGPPHWWLLLYFLPLSRYFIKYIPNKFIATTKSIWSIAKPVMHKRSEEKSSQWDLLKLMLDTQTNEKFTRGLTDDEIIASCCIFLAAGYDTSSTTLSTLTYELAKHPEYQEKLYEEICNVWKDTSVLPTYEDVHEMKYMDKIINETLRLYPAGPLTARACKRDCIIKGTKFYAGTTVIIPIYSLHRDPTAWKKPHEFYPEHFSKDEIAQRDDIMFIPFGYGPRNCIGMRFAMLEIKIVLTRLIRKYKFVKTDSTPEELDMKHGFTAVPKGEIPLIIESR